MNKKFDPRYKEFFKEVHKRFKKHRCYESQIAEQGLALLPGDVTPLGTVKATIPGGIWSFAEVECSCSDKPIRLISVSDIHRRLSGSCGCYRKTPRQQREKLRFTTPIRKGTQQGRWKVRRIIKGIRKPYVYLEKRGEITVAELKKVYQSHIKIKHQ